MRRKITLFIILILATPVFLAGCNQPTAPNSKIETRLTPLATLTVDQQKQKERAIAAKDQLFQSLLGELVTSMGANGPAKSITVCKTRAPEISATIGQQTGVRIGRTSAKLRNSDNSPPEWAQPFVGEQVDKPIEVELPDNGLGVLLPIHLKATCTVCHGIGDQIMPEVKQAIAANYPNDQATGFAEGDLRGYFWVEVPHE